MLHISVRFTQFSLRAIIIKIDNLRFGKPDASCERKDLPARLIYEMAVTSCVHCCSLKCVECVWLLKLNFVNITSPPLLKLWRQKHIFQSKLMFMLQAKPVNTRPIPCWKMYCWYVARGRGLWHTTESSEPRDQWLYLRLKRSF